MKQLVRNAERAEAKLRDRREPLQRIKKRQVQRWQNNFFTQGGEYGSKWAPLSPFTVGRRIGGADIPLVETGGLLTHFTRLNAAGEVSNEAVTWNMSNAGGFGGAAHILEQHFGISPNRGKPLGPNVQMGDVPSRPLWDLDDKDEEQTGDLLYEWVGRIVNQYFGGQ